MTLRTLIALSPEFRSRLSRRILRAFSTLAFAFQACNEPFIPPQGLDDIALVDTANSDTNGSEDVGDGRFVAPEGTCPVAIRLEGWPAASRVSLVGSWNGFEVNATPMRLVDGLWFTELALPPGEYPYKVAVNGDIEGELPKEVSTHWYGDVENRNVVVPDCTRPRLRVEVLSVGLLGADGNATVTATLCAESARLGAAVDMTSLDVDMGEGEVMVEPIADNAGCVRVEATRGIGKHSMTASVKDADGKEATALWVPVWVEDKPFAWQDALLYMAMVDRFRDSDGETEVVAEVAEIANYQGGDFEGLVEAIDEGYFERLGVNAIWLTPVVDNVDGAWLGRADPNLYAGYHGYWPVSAFDIEPRFTSGNDPEEAFRKFVRKSHEKGMRVVVDVVLNHVHQDHIWCKETPEMCRETCVCGTSNCDWEARALDCQFAPYLPDIDYRDHASVVKVADSVLEFARRFDIDGFRLDAVKHVDHVILKALRARVDAVTAQGGAPFWLVGEVFTGSEGRSLINSYIGPGELDGQFDFPLYWAIRDTFVNNGSMRNLEQSLVASESTYGAALSLMSPFLGNHDVERITTAIAKNDLGPFGGTVDLLETTGDVPTRWDIINPLSLAMAFTLTLRGVPLVYMGDEVGLGGSNDPDNRRMVPTSLSADRREVLRRVEELGRARRENAVLRRGNRREIWIDDNIYVQARWFDANASGEGARLIVIAMNKGDGKRIDVTLPDELGVTNGSLKRLDSDETLKVTDKRFSLELDAWEYGLFAFE